MALLSKDQILGAEDMKREVVSVPEWGGDVTIISWTGAQRDAWEASLMDDEKPEDKNPEHKKKVFENYRARYLSHVIIDEAGNLMFSPEEVEALGKKSAAAIMRIFIRAKALNGDGEEAVEKAVKN